MVNKYFINDIHIHEICFCFKYLRVMIASFVILVFLYFKKYNLNNNPLNWNLNSAVVVTDKLYTILEISKHI